MRKFLSLVLALAMAMSLVVVNTSAKEFTDSDDLNYKEAVDVISEIGIVEGDDQGNFNPQQGLTRRAAAKIICNLILGPTTADELRADTHPYSDVAINNEFAGYIAYCSQRGIISGYADGTFRPAAPLTGYAFMKMLLGALGYNQDIEQYVGENWSINVAKQAIGIGLNEGLVEEFNGIDQVTREEAVLYAFNTLKATMVDYENTISANVNGATVTISNNTAHPVGWSEGINNDGNIWADGFVQFAEEYFPDLERLDDDTKFMEPANTWLYDRTEIGTYERTDLLVESYTTGVSGREIYDLLKSGVIRENDLDVYLDGVDNEGSAAGEIEKDDLVRSNTDDLGSTGNGVLTKVYLDTDKELITIVSINTWLAQATTDYSEANEYATLRVYTGVTGASNSVTTANYNVDVEDVPAVADVTDGTFYQVNISFKDVQPNGEIVVLQDVEVLEDSTITEYSSDNGNTTNADAKVTDLTTGGEEYNANVKAFYDDEILYQYDNDLLTDNTYNVYLDQYGYFLGVDLFEGTQNYVFITGFDRNSSNLAVRTATAGAIFLDGTMENIQVNVTATDDNIEDLDPNDDNSDLFIPWSTQGYSDLSNGYQAGDSVWAEYGKYGEEGIYNLNQWYTYTVNDSGVYTLKPCTRMTWTRYPYSTEDTIIRTDNLSIEDSYEVDGRVYGEDASVFLTVDLDVVDTTHGIQKAITDVNGVYTGVQSVDLIVETEDQEAVDEGQVFTVFDSDGYIIGAVVIGEAQGATGNYAYVLSQAKSEGRQDGYYYWTFDAVLEGEKQTLTARSSYADTIRNLTVGEVVELRFDGDYVVNVKPVDNDDIWGNIDDTTLAAAGEDPYHNHGDIERNLDGEDVYLVTNLDDQGTNPHVVSLQRNTLYFTSDRQDVGLGIARDAKAVVIQDENRSTNVVTNFADVESAVNYLVDPNPNTSVKEYDGTIMAVLNSSGAAEWIVFDSDTPLTTGSNPGYGQQGNLQTIYRNSYDVMVNGDVAETLDGSSASVTSVSISQYGTLSAAVTYEAPEWVPAGETVTLNASVYYYGADTGLDVIFPGAVGTNGTATLRVNTTTLGQYLPYVDDVNGINFVVDNETFSAVSVLYYDEDGNRIDQNSVLDMAVTTDMLPTSGVGAPLHVRMPNTAVSTESPSVSIYNTSIAAGPYGPDYGTLRSTTGWTTTAMTATNAAPAYVVIDDTGLNNAYSLTNNFTTALPLSTWGITNADSTMTLSLSVTGGNSQTDLRYNTEVTGTLTLGGTPTASGVVGYRVVNRALDIDVVVDDNSGDAIDFRVTSNTVINASDFTVTPVTALQALSYTWNAGEVRITFNKAPEAFGDGGATVGASSSDVNITSTNSPAVTAWTATVSGNVLILTPNGTATPGVNGNFVAGDTIAITATLLGADGTAAEAVNIVLGTTPATLP